METLSPKKPTPPPTPNPPPPLRLVKANELSA